MHKHAILHKPDDPMAYPAGDDQLQVVLRSARGDLCQAEVVYGDRYTRPDRDRRTPMTLLGRDGLFDYWTARIRLASRRFRYYFVLDDGRSRLYYGECGLLGESPPEDPGDLWAWCFHYAYLWFHDRRDEPPEWAQDAVVYQIFVERFANGDSSNDPPGAARWGARPSRSSFFGGDLKGILDRLDYVSELGISCIYLTPIFLSPTNHKYDTSDYYQVDPRFGDQALTRRLVDDCHARGIRIILDAVFNHCGYDFFAFQDVVRNGRSSRYFEWFNIRKLPVERRPRATYEAFANNLWQMPKLRTDNPEVQDYLLGVAEYWTRTLDIDGWRLDVGDEVDPEFWRKFRKKIRAIKPNALIVGEVLHDASMFLHGDQMDSIMNYPWRELCVAFFAKRSIDATAFADGLTTLRMRYRDQVNRALWNLLDSHDRERFLTTCGGDRRRMLLATTFQFTYPGMPYIYYGDEVGMVGRNDPDCRRCMPWDETAWDRGMLSHYRSLTRLRRRHRVLRRGEYASLIPGSDDPADRLFAFARWDRSSCIIVLMNNTDSAATCDLISLRRRMAAVGGLNRWAGSIFRPVFSVGGAASPAFEADRRADRSAPALSLNLAAACPEDPGAGSCPTRIVLEAMGATVYASTR
ncbi:MAG: glycoside hydrolase family 13 protein [Bacillota bacterium]